VTNQFRFRKRRRWLGQGCPDAFEALDEHKNVFTDQTAVEESGWLQNLNQLKEFSWSTVRPQRYGGRRRGKNLTAKKNRRR
jgi:hypothetical protein